MRTHAFNNNKKKNYQQIISIRPTHDLSTMLFSIILLVNYPLILPNSSNCIYLLYLCKQVIVVGIIWGEFLLAWNSMDASANVRSITQVYAVSTHKSWRESWHLLTHPPPSTPAQQHNNRQGAHYTYLQLNGICPPWVSMETPQPWQHKGTGQSPMIKAGDKIWQTPEQPSLRQH